MAADRIYVRDFPEGFTLADLRTHFRPFGKIRIAYFKTSENGKQCGFVRFWKAESASKALSLNGSVLGEHPLYVALAEKKQERKRALNSQATAQKRRQTQIIVYGLSPDTSTEALTQLFAGFGSIAYANVVKNENRLYGIVQFHNDEAVQTAVATCDKTDVGGSVLRVMRYIPKEALNSLKQVLKAARQGHKAEQKTASSVHRALERSPIFRAQYEVKHRQAAS